LTKQLLIYTFKSISQRHFEIVRIIQYIFFYYFNFTTMFKNLPLLSLMLLFFISSIHINAQGLPDITLKSGTLSFDSNVEQFMSYTPSSSELVDAYYYQLIQFDKIPSEQEKNIFESKGIEFLEYVPNQAYLVKIPQSLDKGFIRMTNAKVFTDISKEFKIEYRLVNNDIPAHAIVGNKIKVVLIAMHGLNIKSFAEELAALQIDVHYYGTDQRFAYCAISERKIETLSQFPWLRYIEIIDEKGEPESTQGRTLQKSNTINNKLTNGLNFDATDVRVLVRDDGLVGPHIDFEGRLNNLTSDATGTHGDGVAGVMAGGGNIDPSVEGGASDADVYVIEYLATFQDNTLSLHQNDNVVITNSSYSNGCNAGYTSSTQTVDNQIYNNPTLMHVFSAGNSNNNNCGYGAGTQWGNVTGGHKVGKNAMTTANLYYNGTIVESSSRGPAHDGRIKPDISAHGQGQMSTNPNNSYSPFGGTSAAAPSMAGNLAQLYDAYKSLNGGNEPNSSLIKAAVLNSATDIGVTGPDFIHGYGLINTGSAYEILENNQYLFSNLSQGGSNNHTINIPSGLGQLKIMIYWHDPAATVNTNKALVNDLDLKVNGTLLPLILNHAPNATTLDDPAVPGIDRLNNVEQVVVDNPAAGNYTINVSGFQVPQGPQEYVIVYSFIENDIKVTYPLGGESLIPGETETIHWDAFGNGGNFNVAYSSNNGSSWTTIGTAAGDIRFLDWTVPNNNSGQALIRVSRSGQSDTSDENFNIFPVPNVSIAAISSNTAKVSWPDLSSANNFDIYQLGNKKMEIIGATTSNEYTLSNLVLGDQIWIAVAANGNGIKGQRSIAQSYTFLPGSSCGGCISGSTEFPDFEGFESDFGSFCNFGTDDLDFETNVGSTPSSDTGPSSAFQGNQYIYLEASSPNYPSKNAILGSPCYDLTNASNASLTFNYHMYGASMGNLNLQISLDGGDTWSTNIWSRTGDQGNNWLAASINLNAYVGNLVSYRFVAETGNSWQSDIALDNITFDATIVDPTETLGEVGKISVNHVYATVNLQNTYSNPIVIAGPPTIFGSNPSTVRIRNITSTSFDIRIDEYEYLDEGHVYETIGYLVIEAGEHTLEDGRMIKAGSSTANSSYSIVQLGTTFPSTPAIMASVVSINDTDAVIPRIRNVNSSSFEMKINEQELDISHGNETIHWLAMEENIGFAGLNYQSEITSAIYRHITELAPLAQAYNTNQVFLANFTSVYGGDVCGMRIRPNYNGVGNLGIFLEEEKSRDIEIAHVFEEMSFVIFENSGNILGTANTDNDHYARNASGINLEKTTRSENPQSSFIIYPNPNNGNFEYNLKDTNTSVENSEIRIFNNEGRLVHQQNLVNHSGKIQLELNKGFYIVQLINNSKSQTQSLVIQK